MLGDEVIYEVIFVIVFGAIGVLLVNNYVFNKAHIISLWFGLFMCLIMYVGIFLMWLKLRNMRREIDE